MVLDLKSHFGTDPKKEIEGEWIEIAEDASLLIARVGNPNFQKAYAKIPAAIKKLLDDDPGGDGKTNPYLAGVVARTVLLGWKGIADEGEKLNYSEDIAKDFLLKYPDFLNFVVELGNERKRYAAQELEEDTKK